MSETLSYAQPSLARRLLPSRQQMPLLATILVCAALYIGACVTFRGFFSKDVALAFFGDNAFLGIAALGLTPVILSGGIDLSVGSMVACANIALATLVENHHFSALAAVLLVLAGGALFGCITGTLIHFFDLTPFLITLGGLFALRGAALLISTDQIAITNDTIVKLTTATVPIGLGIQLPITAATFIALAIVLIFVSLYTSFGRNVYAVGGSEASAVLMGLPVGRTKVLVYTLSGFCSALAGVVYTLYTSSGDATAAKGMELDAIAAVVVGGTLLSGGVGQVIGTCVGVLVFGIIASAINFQGTLDPGWNRIVIGGLLLAFIILQKIIQPGKTGHA
jgi:simple sugar transport system permease protein